MKKKKIRATDLRIESDGAIIQQVNKIDGRVSEIRDHVNHPWQRELIFADKVKWDKVCSCMDVLGDTQLAIDHFFTLQKFSGDNGGHLYLYGLLQAIFLQQDAANHLSEALFNKSIKWKRDYPNLYMIRELRNDAAGHPTKRGDNESFHYIARHSVSKNHFELASYFPKKKKFEHRSVYIRDIIEKHENSICEILDKIIEQMKSILKNHKKKFKGRKLIDFVPSDFGYSVEKVFEGIYNKYPLAEMNFKLLKKSYEAIKSEIDQRYTTYKAISGVNNLVNQIDHIISRLEDWISNKNLYQNKDAEVFMTAFDDRFEELKEMLVEIDKEFNC